MNSDSAGQSTALIPATSDTHPGLRIDDLTTGREEVIQDFDRVVEV